MHTPPPRPAGWATARSPAFGLERTWLQDALPILATLLAILAWEFAGLDLLLERRFGNALGFAWRDHWLTEGLMHDGVRLLAWFVFAVVLVSVWRPLPFARALTQRDRVWWLATTLGCLIVIPLLKRASWTSCPWALAEFGGGPAHYVPHWALGLRDGGPGGCFPSGHASAAFSFLAGWFALRRDAPGPARAWLGATLVIGLICSAGQTVRGAHYASHSMWTAWICWALTAVSFRATRAWRAGPGGQDPA